MTISEAAPLIAGLQVAVVVGGIMLASLKVRSSLPFNHITLVVAIVSILAGIFLLFAGDVFRGGVSLVTGFGFLYLFFDQKSYTENQSKHEPKNSTHS